MRRPVAPARIGLHIAPTTTKRDTRHRGLLRLVSEMDRGPGRFGKTGAVEGAQAASSLVERADEAASFLKALGHDGRLTILCHLRAGPRSVTELENLLSSRQAVVSQQLARLRFEGLVSTRREGQAIIYSLRDPRVGEMISLLERLFAEKSNES